MKGLFKGLVFSLGFAFLSCDNENYDGRLDTPPTCMEANENVSIAQEEFENVNAGNYAELCEDYQTALEQYITSCPESDTEIEALLAELGDCELTSYFQVDFDGQTFFANDAEANLSQGKIAIQGIRGDDGEKVELIVNTDIEGTYNLGVNQNNQINLGQYSPDSNNINTWQSINDSNLSQGQITISDIDYFNSKISGTFNFTAYNETGDVKEFTSGIFENIPLDKENSFFAKVDGEEFVDTQIVPGINNFGWIGLLAIDDNNEQMFIAVRYNATPGDYPLNQDTELSRFDYSPSFQDFHYGEGTVTVLVHNPETNFLMGTFSCIALPQLGGEGTYEITEGQFCVTYSDGSFDED
jgi:hypothetical protein